jgi:predicted GNAT family N-acyltransferase
MIHIKRILAEDTYNIRKEMLRKNIPLPFEFNGDFDKETFHLGAFKNDKLIAISSYKLSKLDSLEGKHYQLRGMATLNDFQGLGAGKYMLQEAVAILKTLKVDYLWCNARLVAVDFYTKQGFLILGDSFMEKFIGEHYVMYKKIGL